MHKPTPPQKIIRRAMSMILRGTPSLFDIKAAGIEIVAVHPDATEKDIVLDVGYDGDLSLCFEREDPNHNYDSEYAEYKRNLEVYYQRNPDVKAADDESEQRRQQLQTSIMLALVPSIMDLMLSSPEFVASLRSKEEKETNDNDE